MSAKSEADHDSDAHWSAGPISEDCTKVLLSNSKAARFRIKEDS